MNNGKKLVRLREQCILGNELFHKTATRLSESQISQKGLSKRLTENALKNKANVPNIISLAESFQKSLKDSSDVDLLERIIKELYDKGIKNTFSVWRLPVSQKDVKNSNGRIYPEKLWANVRDYQKDAWQGLCGMSDHPEDDCDPGLFRDQAVVWHDFEVPTDSKYCFGIASFVGPYGHLGQEILEHGGRIGTSSSGFGDVDSYTNIVDPDTYIIERLADLVINPSQGTYGDISCDHGPDNFIKDVTKGANIEYARAAIQDSKPIEITTQQAELKETKSSIILNRRSNMADIDAIKESVTQVKPTMMSKVEEKAFRKYVESFIADMNDIANPLIRIKEATEILECFDQGQAPELRTKFEEMIVVEKQNLEKLVESTVAVQTELGLDVNTLKENALKIAAVGSTLKDQVIDYQTLCVELSNRVKALSDKNRDLKERYNDSIRHSEKALDFKNKYIVGTSSELDALTESYDKMKSKNSNLMDAVSKLSLGNKRLEKANGLLETKIRDSSKRLLSESLGNKRLEKANDLLETKIRDSSKRLEKSNDLLEAKIRDSSKRLLSESKDNEFIANLKGETLMLSKTNSMLQSKLNEATRIITNSKKLREAANAKRIEYAKEAKVLKENLVVAINTINKLTESSKRLSEEKEFYVKEAIKIQENFDKFVKELDESTNIDTHVLPKASERIGKFINLKEHNGAEIDDYWYSLTEQYGLETMKPYESDIRSCKTLREATSIFMKYRKSIDKDFGYEAIDPTLMRNKQTRDYLMEQAGQKRAVYNADLVNVDKLNEDFYSRMKAAGLN